MTGAMVSWFVRVSVAAIGSSAIALAATWLIEVAVRSRPALRQLVRRLRWPAAFGCALLAIRIGLEQAPAASPGWTAGRQVTVIALIAVVTWLAVIALGVLEQALTGRFDITSADNLRARSARTQIHLLRRVANVAVVVIGVIAALRLLPWGRELGTSLLAAGGIIGVVIGVTGRSTIGNVVAGLQIAFAEPIRLEDVIVVEEEWGNVEEITLTYVVIRLWDERRLVLPTSYFVEQPFQNWTRRRSQVTGAVELWVDYNTSLDEMRAELARLAANSLHWDGRKVVLQVTDTSERAMKLRVLVSAPDGPKAWDLRCEIREGLVRWLVGADPRALPVVRVVDGNALVAVDDR